MSLNSVFGGTVMKHQLLVGAILTGVGILAVMNPALAEQRASREEIRRAIVGKTVTWSPNGGQSYYGSGGSYRFAGYRNSEGTYVIQDGAVCMKFTSGKSRCDAWYKDGSRLYIKPTSAPGMPSSNQQGTIYTAIIN